MPFRLSFPFICAHPPPPLPPLRLLFLVLACNKLWLNNLAIQMYRPRKVYEDV